MKKNVCAMAGGLLCLISLLMSYVTFKQFGIRLYSIGWSTAARYLNSNLYFIPVIGAVMLVSGFVKGKALSALATLAAVVMAVYYAVTFGNILALDSINRLLTEGPQLLALLGNSLNLDLSAGELSTETAAEILSLVRGMQHIGKGYWFFCAGTVLSLIGLVLPMQSESVKKPAKQTTSGGSDIY